MSCILLDVSIVGEEKEGGRKAIQRKTEEDINYPSTQRWASGHLGLVM